MQESVLWANGGHAAQETVTTRCLGARRLLSLAILRYTCSHLNSALLQLSKVTVYVAGGFTELLGRPLTL